MSVRDHSPIERELKLTPDDESLLDRLEGLTRLGPFRVAGHRREQQRNAFFETATGALRGARLAFRRRVIAGQRLATWTLKGPGERLHGVTSRPEVEVHLDADSPPALVLEVLGQAARERGHPVLAERLRDALVGSPPPLAQPSLEMETDRRILDLEAVGQGWSVELALDRVTLAGHPAYRRNEVEAELKGGDPDAALAAARAAIQALGAAAESPQSKLADALEHLRSHGATEPCR